MILNDLSGEEEEEDSSFIEDEQLLLVSEPGKLLKRYSSLLYIRAVQAVVQVAIKVAEEYLPGGEELSEALRNLFFERTEEVSIQ